MPRLRSSVALCTFNGEKFLTQQVESLFAQQRLPDEIVAVDDASTDGSFALLEALSVRSPVPMRAHRNTSTLGHVRNFEKAMSLTNGDLIFLCDQDDVWAPDKIDASAAPFETDEKVMLVHSDAALVDSQLAPLNVSLLEALEVSPRERQLEDRAQAFEVLVKRNIVTGATAVVRRSVFDRALPFPVEFVHDEWLAVVASLMGRLVRIDRPLIQYRQHSRNLIGAERRSSVQKIVLVLGSHGDHQRRIHRRMQRMRSRVPALVDAPDAALFALLDKALAHTAARASLPPPRWKRVPTVLRELANLGYFRYARGWTTAARDLLGTIEP